MQQADVAKIGNIVELVCAIKIIHFGGQVNFHVVSVPSAVLCKNNVLPEHQYAIFRGFIYYKLG
jgi:hypothetical protein